MMLRRLIAQEKPDYLGVVLDSPGEDFPPRGLRRLQGQRAPRCPTTSVAQIPYIERVCEAFRVPVMRLPGFEADDLIGDARVQGRGRAGSTSSSSRRTRTCASSSPIT